MKKKILKQLTYLFIMMMFFSSCKEKNHDKIRVGILDGPSSISFIQLYDNQPRVSNKEIEFIIKQDPQQIQALMMKNELDFAVLPTVMAANLYNKGVKYKALSFPVWGTLYIVTNDPKLKDSLQLQNNTVSVFGQGATPDVLLRRFISDNQLKHVNVDYTYSSNSALATALLSRKVKIAVLSEPMVSSLLIKDKGIRVLNKLYCQDFIFNSDVDVFAQTAFLVNTQFAHQHKDMVKIMSALYSSSCDFINNNPDQAAQLLVKHGMISDLNTARVSLPLCNIRYVGAFAVEREVMRYLNIYYEFAPESIGGKLPDRNFIYQPE